jgi:hypothetical protein
VPPADAVAAAEVGPADPEEGAAPPERSTETTRGTDADAPRRPPVAVVVGWVVGVARRSRAVACHAGLGNAIVPYPPWR